MGEGLARFYRERLQKSWKIAFFSAMAIGLLIHIYKFTNTLPNHDSLFNYYSDQNMVGSGRWLLSIACGLSSWFDLPWVNGLLSLVWLGLTAAVLVALFQMENPVLIVLSSGLLTAFPGTTETFFFEFTADGYFLGMLLSALGVYWTRPGQTGRLRWLGGGACICLSCAIYQAYVSFALVLALCCLMYELLENRLSVRECLRWSLRQTLLFASALAVYYAVWKLCLLVQHQAANDYQGISGVGRLELHTIWLALKGSVVTPLTFFLQWNVLEHGLTLYAVLNMLFLALLAAGLAAAAARSGLLRRRGALALFLLSLLAIPPSICIWKFTSEDVGYRPMMLESIVVLYLFAALLCERWTRLRWKNFAGALLAVIVLQNALMANIGYYHMNQSYERTYADGMEMLLRIRAVQRETQVTKLAVVGNRIREVQYLDFDETEGKMTPSGQFHILSGGLERTMLYDQQHVSRFLRATFGLELETATQKEADTLAQMPSVREMGVWPAEDSMRTADGVLILKLAEPEEEG